MKPALTEKIAYVSYDCFVDTLRLPVIRELNKRCDFHYFAIFGKEPAYMYGPGDVRNYCSENHIPCDIFVRRKRARHPEGAKIALDIVRGIRRFNPDVIYFEGFKDPYLPLLSRCFLGRKRVVVGIHDAVPHENFYSRLFALNERLSISLFRHFHVFSDPQKKAFSARYPRKNLFVARLPACSLEGGKEHISRQSADHGTNFLFFGNIHHYKGLDILIKAANLLAAERNDFTVTIAGKCSDFAPYEAMIERSERFNLRISLIPSGEVPGLFAAADFLVLPYWDVTQSGPLMLALAHRVPVISSDLPGFNEHITAGVNGFLFPPGNADALAACMRNVLNLGAGERDRLRAHIGQVAEKKFALDSVLQEYAAMFHAVRASC